MRAVIAVAEYPEDPFKPICVQTLTEIRMSFIAVKRFRQANSKCAVLIDIELMARTGGIRVLLHGLGEGPLEMAPLLASAFLHIADSPRTRAYLHPGTDLEVSGTWFYNLL